MGINEALELFEITDISNETEESLKSKFRQLTKKYHPDNLKTGDKDKFQNITKALELLKETLNKLQQYKLLSENTALLTILIPLDKLIHIYDGGSITVGSGVDATEINKRAMKQNNTLIFSEVSIEHNGVTYNFDNVQRYDINDNYSVNCDIHVKNLTDSENIKIKVLDKEKEINMSYQSIKMKFTLAYNVVVDVIINKKIIVEE